MTTGNGGNQLTNDFMAVRTRTTRLAEKCKQLTPVFHFELCTVWQWCGACPVPIWTAYNLQKKRRWVIIPLNIDLCWCKLPLCRLNLRKYTNFEWYWLTGKWYGVHWLTPALEPSKNNFFCAFSGAVEWLWEWSLMEKCFVCAQDCFCAVFFMIVVCTQYQSIG